MWEDIYKCANALPITEEDYAVLKKVIKLKEGLKINKSPLYLKEMQGISN